MKPTFSEKEVRHFWQVAASLRWAIRDDFPQDEIDEIRGEIEAVRDYTDSPVLKERCRELLVMAHDSRAAGAAY